ncbi:MAG TPA: PRD domain-containing protein [Candidatus Eisenbergiella merdavium]|uniref:PRD domain-containing protein n=1 Tax=Candidatus Eisenbergiella merdavium TaxID=2838551 RepID=A0A9D2SP30_9FIRM|nr:PRD domain-containing protein [Candidatus Eisenbergiella merdavium]
MFRVKKVLNHNTLIGIDMNDSREYLLIGKGIGFGKKVSERLEAPKDCTVYSLLEKTERGSAMELVREIDPIFLEIAEQVLKEGERIFGRIDWNILFPMADHIAYAVKRIRSGEQISNPLTGDIVALFHMEYKAAECLRPILRERLQVEIDEHEIGYVALHIHSAIEDENVALSMQIARSVRECIRMVEAETGQTIDIMSLAYNRLMNHVRYMAARAMTGEKLKLNMNDYMSVKFPDSFRLASEICAHLSRHLRHPLEEAEIGYLAMHIERTAGNEAESRSMP